jgi:hypothetical protein
MNKPKPDPRAIFSGISAVKARVAANYMRPGRYWLRINRLKLDSNRKNVPFLAIEMQVCRVLDNDNGQGHKVGEDVTHMLMTDNEMFMPNIKAALARILDVPSETITEEECIAVAGDDQPLANTVVEILATEIQTRAGNPFTQVDYKREVPIEEVAAGLDDEKAIELCFPNGLLDKLLAASEEANKQG